MDFAVLQTVTNNFLKELKNAKAGKKTSLPFLVHHLSPTPLAKNGETFQVLTIGGSICKNARVKKEGDKVTILEVAEKKQPIFATKEDLLRFVANEIRKDALIVAMNFAYPITPIFEHGRLDGRLMRSSKEHAFKGLIGEKVCENIETYLQETRRQEVIVVGANDTICLLLSGLTKFPWKSLACGIVGTGMNEAFFLKKDAPVNLESNSFSDFEQTDVEKAIDTSSDHPGGALFEKTITGAYLYKHFNILVKEKGIAHYPISSTKELDAVAREKTSEASLLARGIFERSGGLIACQTAALLKFKKQNLTFVMEGSVFWKAYHYKEIVADTVTKLVPEYTASFVEIQNSTVLGAAKLVA